MACELRESRRHQVGLRSTAVARAVCLLACWTAALLAAPPKATTSIDYNRRDERDPQPGRDDYQGVRPWVTSKSLLAT